MSRYIDADKVLEKINKICNRCGKMNENNGAMCGACYFDDAKDMIDDFPTAEVKPIVYGKWKRNDVSLVYKCSVCKNARISFPYPYCPICGAKMMNSAKW